MLHATKMEILGMTFTSPEPKEFKHIGGGGWFLTEVK
jgi:hypothetical protein